MKHRIFAAIIAALMLLSLVPAAGAAAGYDPHDLAALTAFLELPSAVEGKRNGEILSPDYDPEDPATFLCDPEAGDSNTYTVTWEKGEDGVFRLAALDLRDKTALAGELDLSGCEALWGVSLYDLPLVTGLRLAGCAKLQTLYCRECGVTAIDASGCQSLWMVNVGGPELGSIVLADFGIFAEGPGAVSALIDGVNNVLTAEPSSAFLGWYCGGELISCEPELDITGLNYPGYTARFAPAEPMPGDIDGDGELTFGDVSSLYGRLIGGGPADLAFSVGDVDLDGDVGFADVGALYRKVLGEE